MPHLLPPGRRKGGSPRPPAVTNNICFQQNGWMRIEREKGSHLRSGERVLPGLRAPERNVFHASLHSVRKGAKNVDQVLRFLGTATSRYFRAGVSRPAASPCRGVREAQIAEFALPRVVAAGLEESRLGPEVTFLWLTESSFDEGAQPCRPRREIGRAPGGSHHRIPDALAFGCRP